MAEHAARGPIEKKVSWATAGSFAVSLVIAILNGTAGNNQLLGSLPGWAQSFLIVVGPSLATFLSGYFAKHTPRPDATGTVGFKSL